MGCQWAATGRCHCLWKERWMADRGSKGEKRQREWARPKQPCPFAVLSSFYIPVPLPTWTKVGLCFYLLASGAALAVTGHCGWMCSRNASAWLYMSMERHSLSFWLFITEQSLLTGLFFLCLWIAGIDLFHLSIGVPQITSYFICLNTGYFVFFDIVSLRFWFFFYYVNILCVFPPYPDEYKSKVVCEEERMRLSCKRGMQIAVYSAMFGRTQQGTLECPLHHMRASSVGEAPSHSHSGGCGCQMTHKPSAPALL